jgi:hypothetical protein
MNRLSTILLVLTAIGLAVFVGTTHRWRFSTERVIQPGRALFQFDPDEISGISIKNGDQSFRIQRSDDGWHLTKGLEDSASPQGVNALIQTALETPVLDRIDATEIRDDKNLSGYGVLKSSLQIDFKGDKPPSLLIGKTSPDGTRQYVSFENSKTVYLIPKDIVHLITLPIEKYRDQRLLPIDPAQVERIVFRKGNSSLELQRDASSWKILRPMNAPADDSAVEDLLSKIHALRLESFQSENKPESTGDSRLDSSAEAQFFTSASEGPYSIRIEPRETDGSATAHLDARKISGTVSANATKLFSPDIETLRDTSLLRINLDLVDVIRIENNGSKRDITRTREGWSDNAQSVQDIAKTLAQTKVSARLPATPLEIKNCGLDSPSKRISLLSVLSENTPETSTGEHLAASLAIGKPLADGRLPVLVEGTPEIRLVPAILLKLLP